MWTRVRQMMAGQHTVTVATYGKTFAITLPYPSDARTLKEAVGAKLGLRSPSLPVFSIFEGPLSKPTRIFNDTDRLPQGAENLNMQKWYFDVQKEEKLVRRDDAAIHLLYSQALFQLEHGALRPTDSELADLQSFLDPNFPTERQFVDCARTIRGYTAFTVTDCKLVTEVLCNDANIPSGCMLTCAVDLEGMVVEDNDKKCRIEWPWRQIRRWKLTREGTIDFEVCLQKQNAPIMEWMKLETKQARVVLHAAHTICSYIKDKETTPQATASAGTLPGRPIDPLVEFVNNELFGQIQFSSIDK